MAHEQQRAYAVAKIAYSEACRAYLQSDPLAQEKVEQALERLRAAEAPVAPAGEGFRAGAPALFVVHRR
jgi:hypothetical protein